MSLRKDLDPMGDENEIELSIPEGQDIEIKDLEGDDEEDKEEVKQEIKEVKEKKVEKAELEVDMEGDKDDFQLEVREQPKKEDEENSESSSKEKADSTSSSSEDSEIKSEIEYEPEVKFTCVQRIFQQVIKFEGAFTPTILFKPLFPPLSHSMGGILEAASCPLNAVVGDALIALTTKENPFSGFKAVGDDNPCIGFVASGTSTVIALGTMTIAGFGVHCLIKAYAPEIILSENEELQKIGADAMRAALIGLGCYIGAEGIKAIGMKIWAYCIPSKNEKVKEHPNLNPVQIAGQYMVRLFGDIAGAEAVLFYLDIAGLQAITSVPRYQNLIFIGKSGIKKMEEYFACTPHPLNALVPEKERTQIIKGRESLVPDDDEEEEYEVIAEPSNCEIAKHMSFRTLAQLTLLASAYVISEMTCYIAETQGSNLCSENTFGNRVSRYVIALGVPLATDYVVHHAGKKIKSALQNYWPSFFGKSSAREDGFYPLIDEDGNDNHLEDNSLLRKSL